MVKEILTNKTYLTLIAGALLLVCAALGVGAWTAFNTPAFASIIGGEPAPAQIQEEKYWAKFDIVKPLANSIDASAFTAQTGNTPVPTLDSSSPQEDEPATSSTDIPATSTPSVTETPGEMMMEIVANTFVPTSAAPKPAVASRGNGTRWIDVDLTSQRVYAYEGDIVVNSFIVSTGTWLTPTVTGQFNIYIKYRSNKMSGPGYYLADVPYIMYFHGNYGLHGTYWHNNFGTPMSHGCVNLSIEDAGWLYEWASVGTLVNVHY
jgi:lipoprotein-anchoring transpeptidase ErfK/SrfK